MLQRLLACLVLAIAATGCSKSIPDAASATQPSETPRTVAQLDEAGLIAAVGSPVVYEVPLDNGRGLKFRPKYTPQERQPAFSLEFRKGRINVMWEQYTDNAKFDAAKQWADQVLTYALGKEATAKIKSSIAANTPLRGEVLQGHKVNVMPGGGTQVLVTITL